MQITKYWNQVYTYSRNFVSAVKSDRNVQIGLIAIAAISIVGIIFLALRSSKSTPQIAKKDKQTNNTPSKKSELSTTTKDISGEKAPQKVQEKEVELVENKNEVETIKTPDIPSGKITLPLYPPLELIPFAEARKGKDPGDLPNSEYVDCFFDIAAATKGNDKKRRNELNKKLERLENTLADPDEHKKHITALFASCFHTSESHQEIYQLLINIREKIAPIKPEEEFPLVFLCQNLLALLDELPLEKFPQMKIYWSRSVEEKLIPHLISVENFNPKNLLLAYVSGEEILSPYQATHMDFDSQFQFVAVDYDQFLISFNMVMKEWANLVYLSHWQKGDLIDANLMKNMVRERKKSSVNQAYNLVDRANFFGFSWNAYHHLSEMKKKNMQIFFDGLDQESKIKHLRALYSSLT